jgi:hypothetical protein
VAVAEVADEAADADRDVFVQKREVYRAGEERCGAPALAETLKSENVNPPRSHPAVGNSVTSGTLMQLMASALGGPVLQPTMRRANERSRMFLRIVNLLLHSIRSETVRTQKSNAHAKTQHGHIPRLMGHAENV